MTGSLFAVCLVSTFSSALTLFMIAASTHAQWTAFGVVAAIAFAILVFNAGIVIGMNVKREGDVL